MYLSLWYSHDLVLQALRCISTIIEEENMSASCAGKSDKTEVPAGWQVLPVTETGPWSCGDFEVEKGFKFPAPSNVVGYALFMSKEAPDLPKNVRLKLRCWIDQDGFKAKLVDERILYYQETQSWRGWKSFPLVSPASEVSNIRVNVKEMRKGTSLSGEVRPSEGIRFYSKRPKTAFYRAQRAVADAIARSVAATDMGVILVFLCFILLFGFAQYALGLDATAFGNIAFAAGFLSPPLTSKHRSYSLLAPL
jgi:hypothetical protein